MPCAGWRFERNPWHLKGLRKLREGVTGAGATPNIATFLQLARQEPARG
jgi:hypothetical protein